MGYGHPFRYSSLRTGTPTEGELLIKFGANYPTSNSGPPLPLWLCCFCLIADESKEPHEMKTLSTNPLSLSVPD